MITFLALTVVPLAVLALIMVLAVWLTNRLAERMVGRKHHLLEGIVQTGAVPDAWRSPFARRLANAQGPALAAIQKQAHTTYLAQLDALIRYAETSPLVEDEDTRDALLDRLDVVRAEWEAGVR